MSDDVKKSRPEFRNIHFVKDLPKYHWPMASMVSGAHRFSGLLLFLLTPIILYFLDQSLLSEGTFAYLKDLSSGWFVKLIILAMAWGYLQHFCSGIRHLVMDLHIGLDKESASKSGAGILAVTSALTILIALKLFGAF
jgi:succinate dehydrogenase / fumarate reductase cytochrome b subunit